MAIAESANQDSLMVLGERERVCLRPRVALDAHMLNRLETEAHALIGRGFERLTIDLRDITSVDWTAAATIAAISRFARRSGARLTVIPGNSPAVQLLLRAGLMRGLTIETAPSRPFFDWSR